MLSAHLGGRRATLVAVFGAVLLAAAALALVWHFLLRDSADPASLETAIAQFRADRLHPDTTFPVPTPQAGVYLYETSGFESVDVLLGSRHEYPPRTTITVEPGGCGLLLRWDALETRSTTWDVCPQEDGWTIRSYSEVHRFFGQTERTTYVCDAGSLWAPASTEPGTTFERRCASADTREEAAGTVVGVEAVPVDGSELDTVHLALALTLNGRTSGTGTFDVWLATTNGLIARLGLTNDNASDSAVGAVQYREVAELDLLDTEPRT